jgi:Zn-dependent metalloprotease
VHINNNIHNKAAYNLLTMAEDGRRVFTVQEATVLFYLAMTRVPSQATFSDSLQTLTHVAKTYYSGEPAERDRKLAAITRAYSEVGITS